MNRQDIGAHLASKLDDRSEFGKRIGSALGRKRNGKRRVDLDPPKASLEAVAQRPSPRRIQRRRIDATPLAGQARTGVESDGVKPRRAYPFHLLVKVKQFANAPQHHTDGPHNNLLYRAAELPLVWDAGYLAARPRGKAERYSLRDTSLHGCRAKYCSIGLFCGGFAL